MQFQNFDWLNDHEVSATIKLTRSLDYAILEFRLT